MKKGVRRRSDITNDHYCIWDEDRSRNLKESDRLEIFLLLSKNLLKLENTNFEWRRNWVSLMDFMTQIGHRFTYFTIVWYIQKKRRKALRLHCYSFDPHFIYKLFNVRSVLVISGWFQKSSNWIYIYKLYLKVKSYDY